MSRADEWIEAFDKLAGNLDGARAGVILALYNKSFSPADNGRVAAHMVDSLVKLAQEHGASQWMPIESAPKDGTWVQLWCGEWTAGFWGAKKSRYGVNYGDAWGNGHSWDCQFPQTPTHWMPLPAPPLEAHNDAG